MDVGLLDLGKHWDDVPADERVVGSLLLARRAEQLGAQRYWLAEHHVADVALHAPKVMLPLVTATPLILPPNWRSSGLVIAPHFLVHCPERWKWSPGRLW